MRIITIKLLFTIKNKWVLYFREFKNQSCSVNVFLLRKKKKKDYKIGIDALLKEEVHIKN